MSAIELMYELQKLEANLFLVDGELQLKAPKGALSQELLQKIRENKEDLIWLFSHTSVNDLDNPIEKLDDSQKSRVQLSFAQQRLWFMDQVNPGSPFYNISNVLELKGRLNVPALLNAIHFVAQRHESFRTRFCIDQGEPYQCVVAEPRVEISELDGAGKDPSEIEEHIKKLIHAPFDLKEDPLFRVTLIKYDETCHRLVLVLHHIISDGWSMKLMFQELAQSYQSFANDELPTLSPRPIDYTDYAAFQRKNNDQWLTEDLSYWKDKLADIPPVLALPTDHARPATQSYKGRSVWTHVSNKMAEQLRKLGLSNKLTLSMVMLTAYHILLSRYSRQASIVIGMAVANRGRREIEDVIGFFVNSLPIRLDFEEGTSVHDLLAQMRKTSLEAFSHQELPFDKLVEGLQIERDNSYSPVFQAMYSYDYLRESQLKLDGLEIAPLQLDYESSKFDLTLSVSDTHEGLKLQFEYSSDLFEASTINRMAERYVKLLKSMLENQDVSVSDLDMLAESEQQVLLQEWRGEYRPYPKVSVASHFESMAIAQPDLVAVLDEKNHLTYWQLNAEANRLAHHLISLGIGSETPVAICGDRSLDLVVGFLAILKAGGVYVPIDADYPKERINYMLSDTQVGVVVAQSRYLDAFPDYDGHLVALDVPDSWSEEMANPGVEITGESLACIIYTSGSTGKPKGVNVTHKSIMRLVTHTNYLEIKPTDVVAHVSNVSFDAATFEIWGALLNGARICIIGKETYLNLTRFQATLEANSVNIGFVTTAMFNLLSDKAPNIFAKFKYLLFGGEACDISRISRVIAEGKPDNLLHVYGPTENTTFSTYFLVKKVDLGANTVPIGRGIANGSCYVLDEGLNLVGAGMVGELYLGGDGLARGYHNQYALTAETFVPNPFDKEPGARLYRTKDLVRWNNEGQLEFVGRADHQVKIRGFRIELGEIESVIEGHDDISDCLVSVYVQNDLKQLVTYYTSESIGAGELRDYMAERLPNYMLPDYFVHLSEFPLTPNGKVDMEALPEPHVESEDIFLSPITEREQVLAGIWEDLLKIERVGVNDNFFELGGHSLLMTQMLPRINVAFNVELEPRAIFDNPILHQLSKHIQKCQQKEAGFSQEKIPVVRDKRKVALSFAQQRLWFMDKLNPGSAFYNVYDVLDVKGCLHKKALFRSIDYIARRHEAFKTVFNSTHGDPYQTILGVPNIEVEEKDVTGLTDENVQAIIKELVHKPFDLNSDALLRVLLLKLGDKHYQLVLSMHHIVSDGWSMRVLFKELTQCYYAYSKNLEPSLPALEIHYSDYSAFQRCWYQNHLEQDLRYWREQLDGIPPLINLPLDYARPSVQSYKGQVAGVRIDPEVVSDLKRLSLKHNITLSMALMAAFHTLLYRYSGQDSIVVGMAVANRGRRELEELIGFFVNSLPIRINFSNTTKAKDLFAQIRQASMDAFEHQELPFEKLVEELKPERDAGYSPVFQVMYTYEHAHENNLNLPELEISAVTTDYQQAKYDLTMGTHNSSAGVWVQLEYATDLFTEQTIVRMLAHYQMLLADMVGNENARISQLKLISLEETQQAIHWAGGLTDYAPDENVVSLFRMVAQQMPDKIALISGDRALTYRELDSHADQMFACLVSQGVRAGERVGVTGERSSDLLASILGILKAGAVYVPLESGMPEARLRYILADSNITKVVDCGIGTSFDFPGVQCIKPSDVYTSGSQVNSDRLKIHPRCGAYVMYTSGSTGNPKGVVATHRGVIRLVRDTSALKFRADDVFLQMAPTSFDASTLEIWGALLSGATLVIAPPGRTGTEDIRQQLRSHNVTVLWLTAALFHMVVRERVDVLKGLRCVLAGGDVLIPGAVNSVLKNVGCSVINGYGPTENTTFTCCHVMNSSEDIISSTVPIGRPIDNTMIYVLDDHMNFVPNGMVGELCAEGDGLGWGYLGAASRTAGSFVPSPFSKDGGRMYKTGDLVRWRADGTLEFIGRKDQQIKLRGFRIELGEVESALNDVDGVVEGKVVVREREGNDKYLVAYFIQDEGTQLDAVFLRNMLKQHLPDYMVPSFFVVVNAFPVNQNGKVDTKALPMPELNAGKLYLAPYCDRDAALSDIWKEVLKVDRVGLNDSFFELGGHSLLATQLIPRINATFNVETETRAVFDFTTLQALSDHIQVFSEAQHAYETKGSLEHKKDKVPLSNAQQMTWQRYVPNQVDDNQVVYADLEFMGDLDVDLIERMVTQVATRHEAFRTTFFVEEGRPYQRIMDTLRIELFRDYQQEDLKMVDARVSALKERSFDLGNDPLLRVLIAKCGEQMWRFSIVAHSIIADAWSLRLVLSEIVESYSNALSGISSNLRVPRLQYSDVCFAQQRPFEGESASISYWRHVLRGVEHVTKPNWNSSGSDVVDTLSTPASVSLDADFLGKLKRFALDYETTFDVVVLACFYVALHRCLAQEDILIGVCVPGRDKKVEEYVVGPFSDVKPIRAKAYQGQTFEDLIKYIKASYFNLQKHKLVVPALVFEQENVAELSGVVDFVCAFFNYQHYCSDLAQNETIYVKSLHPIKNIDQTGVQLDVIDSYDQVELVVISIPGLISNAQLQELLDTLIEALNRCVESPEADAWVEEQVVEFVVTENNLAPGLADPGVCSTRTASPLGYSQLDHWFLYFYTGDPGVIDVRVELEGDLDKIAMHKALDLVVSRHDAFWVSISRLNPVQVFSPPGEIEFSEYDVSGLDADRVVDEINRISESQTLDLKMAPIFRAALIRKSDSVHVLMLKLSHITVDGTSISIFINEVLAEYGVLKQGQDSTGHNPMSMMKFIQSERDSHKGENYKKSVAYWKSQVKSMSLYQVSTEQFASAGEDIPTMSIVSAEGGYRVAKTYADKLGVSVQMFLLSVLVMTLSKFNGATNLTIKSNYSNRHEVGSDTVIGNIYKEIIFNVALGDVKDIDGAIKSVKGALLEALSHRYCPWVMPAALFERKKWPFIFKPFWYVAGVFSWLLSRTVFAKASMHPMIISYYLSYLDVPFQKFWRKLTLGFSRSYSRRKIGVTIGVNSLIEMEDMVEGVGSEGLHVKSINKQGHDDKGDDNWVDETLYFEFSRGEEDAVKVSLVGGGLNAQSRGEVLHIYKEILKELGV